MQSLAILFVPVWLLQEKWTPSCLWRYARRSYRK